MWLSCSVPRLLVVVPTAHNEVHAHSGCHVVVKVSQHNDWQVGFVICSAPASTNPLIVCRSVHPS